MLEMYRSFIAPLPPLRGPPARGRLGLCVSVPLRGCGFKILNQTKHINAIFSSFRPLAGMWF